MQISKAIGRPNGDKGKLRCSALSIQQWACCTHEEFQSNRDFTNPAFFLCPIRIYSLTAESKLGQGRTLFTLASYCQYVGER